MRKPALFGALFVAVSAQQAAAQKAEYWITRLGNDTVAFERYVRAKDRLEGQFVVTTPRVRVNQYTVTFNPDGTVRRYEASSKAGLEGSGAPPQSAVAEFEAGSIVAIVTRNAKPDTTRIAAGKNPLPNALYAWGLFGLATQAARALKADSVVVEQWAVGARAVAKTSVTRRDDSLVVDFFQSPMMVKADKKGRPTAVNGMRTTVKVLAQKVKRLDLAALTESFVARERAGQTVGALSTRDTVQATVLGTSLWIDYGRPSKRGRQIVGGVVPYDQVWRTGANAATQFRVDRAVVIGGATVPAGMYTLWTLPTTVGIKLIINKQTGQWGTAHDPRQDLVRVDLDVERLDEMVERFTISAVEAGGVGQIRFDWDHTRWVVRFRVP